MACTFDNCAPIIVYQICTKRRDRKKANMAKAQDIADTAVRVPN